MTRSRLLPNPARVNFGASPHTERNENAAQPTAAKSPRFPRWIAIGLAVVVHLASAYWHIFFGAQNTDEGFYAVATRAVAQGEMPYRDFGFSQPPLVLYANCLPLRIIGPGLFAQRTVNGFWAAAALLAGATWLARRTQTSVGGALVLSFSLAAPWMYFTHLGKTHGIATLIVMLGGWAFLALRNGPRRNFVLGMLAALGLGARLPTAPFFGLLWAFALWPGRRPTLNEAVAAFGGLATCAIGLPFWFAAPAQIKFWMIDLHRLSLPYRDWQLGWREIVALAPAVWLIAGVALLIAIFKRRVFTRECGVLLAALAGLAANLLPTGVYEDYGVPFLLPLAVAAAAMVYLEFKNKNRVTQIAIGAALIVAQFIITPLLSRNIPQHSTFPNQWLSLNAPPYNRALPEQLATARGIVEKFLAPTAPFIGPNIILAAETGRSVPPELRMGPFSFTLEMSPEEAARLHLTTHEQLDQWFTRPDVTVLAFFRRRELNYGWTMPTFGQLREDVHTQWFAPLRRDFELAYQTDSDFLLLVRKSPADVTR